MRSDRSFCWKALVGLLWAAATLAAAATPPAPATKSHPGMAEILAASPATAWRPLVDEHTLYMELPAGRVIIELEPALAPHTVATIEALVRMHYFDGAAVVRVQDNFVAQWSNPDTTRKLPDALQRLAPEFTAPLSAGTFTELPDRDGYAPQVGFIDSFPAARDPAAGRAWLAHCYGAVGVGRDNDPATGNGAELYAVIGHAPRQLDRNVTVVGRIRQGIELARHPAARHRGAGLLRQAGRKCSDQPHHHRRRPAGRAAHPARSIAHRLADLRGRGRGASQPHRCLVRAAGRATSTCAARRCRCASRPSGRRIRRTLDRSTPWDAFSRFASTRCSRAGTAWRSSSRASPRTSR